MRSTQVKEFHTTYGQPVHSEQASFDHMSTARIAMRLGLIIEEVKELLLDGFDIETEIAYRTKGVYTSKLSSAVSASNSWSILGAADALGDLSYVIDGFAIEAGIPLDAVINEIHSSNMSKLDADGFPIYREDGKVLKGPNFREPDLYNVIFKKDK